MKKETRMEEGGEEKATAAELNGMTRGEREGSGDLETDEFKATHIRSRPKCRTNRIA